MDKGKEPAPKTFEEWAETKEGRECLRRDTITDDRFLRNRLWWAFQAGAKSVVELSKEETK